MRKNALLFVTAFALSGCLAKKLQTPTQDHYVQAATISDSCGDEGWGQGVCTQEMIDEMAEQAKCLHAITVGEDCTELPEEPKP